MSETVIRVEGLSKHYHLGMLHQRTNSFRDSLTSFFKRHSKRKEPEIIWALKEVSFKVKEGEILGIIGPNGAGKSTLLKILSRITKPTHGEVFMDGRVGSLLEVGTGFHPELTGRENIYLNGAILGMRKAEIKRKFDEIVTFAEIEKFIGTPVKHYSSGMYVRLAFAVAAHLQPEILLVDEVLAVGDLGFQKKCLNKMGDVAKGGRTVLFVSHNMPAIENLCTRVQVLNKGKLLFDGGTKTGIERYSDLMSRESDIPLYERVDRTGTGMIRIESFQILDSRGIPVEQLMTGRDYTFRFEFRSKTSKVNDIDFAFAVRDSMNRLIFRNRTTESGIDLPKILPSNGYFDCRIPSFPLTRGRYAFGFRLLVNGEESDYITGGYAAHFDVEEGDYYKTGKISSFAPVVVQHEWNIVSQDVPI